MLLVANQIAYEVIKVKKCCAFNISKTRYPGYCEYNGNISASFATTNSL